MEDLLEKGHQVVADPLLQGVREAVPDGLGGNGHSTSHCVASVTNAVTLSSVSLVPRRCRGGASEVAESGMRRRMRSR